MFKKSECTIRLEGVTKCLIYFKNQKRVYDHIHHLYCVWCDVLHLAGNHPGDVVPHCRFGVVAAGIVLLVQGIRIREMLGRSVRMLPAVVCVVIGIWILARPGVFVSLIPILIGVMLAYHGFKDLVFCLEVKKASSPRWWIGLLVAIATIIIGVILMLHTWLALEIGMMAVGVILIYDASADCG